LKNTSDDLLCSVASFLRHLRRYAWQFVIVSQFAQGYFCIGPKPVRISDISAIGLNSSVSVNVLPFLTADLP
jgi:hypothetical protein